MDGIEIAVADEQILETYDEMSQLRPHIPASEYVRIVKLQQAESDYQLAASRKANGSPVSLASASVTRLRWAKTYMLMTSSLMNSNARRVPER